MFLLSILLTLLIGSILYVKWSRRHFNKCADTLPQDPGWPILGNVLPFFKHWNVMTTMRSLSDRYMDKGICAIRAGFYLTVLVFDAELLEKVLDSNKVPYKGNFLKFITGDLFDGVVVSSGGSRWKELKKPINKLFTKKQISDEYFGVFVEKSKILLNFLKEHRVGKEYDVLPDCFNYAFDAFGETHTGVRSNEIYESKHRFLEYIDSFIEKATVSAVTNPLFLLQGKKRPGRDAQMRHYIQKANDALQWILDERRKIIETSHKKPEVELYTDWLIRRAKEKNISDKRLRMELVDLVSGLDSPGVVLSSALLYIAMFPEIQDRLYREQLEVLGSERDRPPTWEDYERMEFLERVIWETIRHVSPPGTTRKAADDICFGEYTIPKKAMILAYGDGLHRNPKYWDRPNEFYPDHFLPEKIAKRPELAFIPFGIGNRSCPGWKWSIVASAVALSFILRTFRLSTSLQYHQLVFKFTIMRQIHGDVAVKFEYRNPQEIPTSD